MEDASAIVVIGDDPVATAHTALGIGRIQARRRRVAIGDLVGEVEPLQALITGDDPHGIVDSFLYGVSLNKIARQVDAGSNLFVMPSGTEPVITEEILRSERWRRLADGFREVGALLLLVAPASAAGVEELVTSLDGAIVVGNPSSASIPADQVLATVPGPARRARTTAPLSGLAPSARAAPVAARGRWWIAPLLVAVLLLAAAGVWLLRDVARGQRGAAVDRTPAARPPAARPRDKLPQRDSASASIAAADRAPVVDTVAASIAPAVLPSNPADSTTAGAYGVLVVAANTERGATIKLRDTRWRLPAATLAPIKIGADSARWYRVIGGAFATPRQADSLLAVLRRHRILAPGGGSVVRTPYALLVERSVSREAARALAAGYVARGLPVYALLQADGSAQLYAGAFETPEQASILATSLRAAGIAPTVVFRTGRVF